MSLLLTWEQQQVIKPWSANNKGKYNQLAIEVENNEITKLIGIKFLQEIQNNLTSYNAILDETEFEDNLGDTVKHKGLRYVIAYMNYSKYIGQSFVNDTFTGFVQKTRTDAELISEGRIKALQEENRSLALNAWETIKEYLNINYELYPLWHSKRVKIYRPKIFGLKKTRYNGE